MRRRRKARRRYKIQIGDDLPIPESKKGRPFRFPFDKIEIGMHFIIHGMKHNILGPYKQYAEENLAAKFVTRMIRDKKGKTTGIAVWRSR